MLGSYDMTNNNFLLASWLVITIKQLLITLMGLEVFLFKLCLAQRMDASTMHDA